MFFFAFVIGLAAVVADAPPGLLVDKPSAVPAADPRIIDQLKLAAAKGSADALYNLGVAYRYGEGVIADRARAQRYFQYAAEGGHVDGLVAFGIGILEGSTPPSSAPDRARALESFVKAASRGNAEGAYRAALLLYENASRGGSDEEATITSAFEWAQRAVDGGHGPAHRLLGIMLEYGAGSHAQDFLRARTLYSTGCEKHRDADACYYAGLMSSAGRGSVQDFTRAAMDFRSALSIAPSHAGAAFALGSMFLHGQGTGAPDAFAAREMLRIAATAGGLAYGSLGPFQRTEAAAAFAALDNAIRLADAEAVALAQATSFASASGATTAQ